METARTQPALEFDQGTLLLSGFSELGVRKIFPRVPWQFDRRVSKFRTDANWFAQIQSDLTRVQGPVVVEVTQWDRVGWPQQELPELLTCQDWRLLAPISIGSGGQQLALQLTGHDGLSSSKLPAPDFDSEVEAELMEKWNAAPLVNWTLRRESELLFRNQKVFTPDFVATHSTGQQVHIEVLGFWTPEYLRAKVQTLIEFADHPILVLAQENKKESLEKLGLPANQAILWYKSSIPLKLLQQTIRNFAE